MPFLKRNADQVESPNGTLAGAQPEPEVAVAQQKITFIACFLGLVASIGGFMFGYVRYVGSLFLLI